MGAPPSTSVGVGLSLSPGRGATSVPVQSAIVGFTLGVGLLVATLGFGTSLQRLLDTPRLYGWTWDIKSGAPALPDIGGLVIPALRADADIHSASRGDGHPGRPRGPPHRRDGAHRGEGATCRPQ